MEFKERFEQFYNETYGPISNPTQEAIKLICAEVTERWDLWAKDNLEPEPVVREISSLDEYHASVRNNPNILLVWYECWHEDHQKYIELNTKTKAVDFISKEGQRLGPGMWTFDSVMGFVGKGWKIKKSSEV